MLDIVHHSSASVILGIMIVVIMTISIALELEVSTIRVLRNVHVCIMVYPMRPRVMLPIVWHMLYSVVIVMVINMLGIMFTLISIAVIVSHVVVTLWFHIMVLTVLLSCEVALFTDVGYMVLQVPVALAEMSIRMMLITTN